MLPKLVFLALMFWGCAWRVQAQDFKIFDRTVQVHGFATQGFVHTDKNNWLTMNTSHVGSGEFTDFGGNASLAINDKFRVGAQVYDRNLGHLGGWHPSLDWGYAQYKFSPWFGIRGGVVKTVMGLYNDTQDLDFLHTFALLPQAVYSIDLRDTTIAHTGGDVFGTFSPGKKLGALSYTAYAGQREDSKYGGYAYLVEGQGLSFRNLSGLQYGGDLRWFTPVRGFLVGVSRMNEDTSTNLSINLSGLSIPIRGSTRSAWTNQFYGQYIWNKLQLDSEYRRYWRDGVLNGVANIKDDIRGWYFAGSYRVLRRLTLGSYYSHYTIEQPAMPQTFLPPSPAMNGYSYDKVVTARVDINRFVNLKVEGHFMDGYGLASAYPVGFYVQDNPRGLKPLTNALVIKTGFSF